MWYLSNIFQKEPQIKSCQIECDRISEYMSEIARECFCQRLMAWTDVRTLCLSIWLKHACQNTYQNMYVAGICLESVQIPLRIAPAPKHGMLQTKGGNVAFPPNLEPLIQPKQDLVWFKNTVKATQKHWDTPWNYQCKPIMANQISNSKLDLTMKHNSRTPCIFLRSPYAVITIELYHKWP